MAKQQPLKDHFIETRMFTTRVLTAMLCILALLLILLARLVYLQLYNHDVYKDLSDKNHVDIRAVPPIRGLIYDRNGTLLAENVPAFSLEIIPERQDDLEQTLADLAMLVDISEQDIRRFKKNRRHTPRFEPVPLKTRLSDEEVAIIAVNQHRFPGVNIEARLVRHYPYANTLAHTLGYVGRINERELQNIDTENYRGTNHIGKIGLEKYYEDQLHGQIGYEQVEVDARGRIFRVLERTPPTPGANLLLHLDLEVQRTAEQALIGERGAVVALDAKNGGVLALVSTPAYDPNDFVNGIDIKTYAGLRESQEQPLFNRAIRGRYPPGSTIKPLVGLAALEYQIVHPAHKINDIGWYQLKGDERIYRDWKKEGHGRVDFNAAIAQSCDTYFYDLGFKLGITRIHNFVSQFGFGEPTQLDMGEELSGLLPSADWKQGSRGLPWFPGDSLNVSIGQGFWLVSPIELATGIASLVNRGQTWQPSMVAALEQGDSMTHINPTRLHPTVTLKNDNNWQQALQAMEDVVHGPRGTARKIGLNAPYRMGGKTGTAQVFGIKQDEEYDASKLDRRLHDHALFVGFAPIEDPQIVVAVVVENGGSGSSTAAPIARAVMDSFLLTP